MRYITSRPERRGDKQGHACMEGGIVRGVGGGLQGGEVKISDRLHMEIWIGFNAVSAVGRAGLADRRDAAGLTPWRSRLLPAFRAARSQELRTTEKKRRRGVERLSSYHTLFRSPASTMGPHGAHRQHHAYASCTRLPGDLPFNNRQVGGPRR